jgi:hypothetical protein
MSMELAKHRSRWVQQIITALFHIARYLAATCASGFMLVIVPLIIIGVLAVLIALFLLLVWLGFFLGAPLDGGAIQAIFWFVVAPVSLVLSTIISVASTLIAVIIYLAVGVLPLSALVELAFWRFADKKLTALGILSRFASFALAGVILGVVVGSIGLLAVQPETLLGVGIIYIGTVVVSVCTLFFYGIVLTILLAVKDGMLALWRKLQQKKSAA